MFLNVYENLVFNSSILLRDALKEQNRLNRYYQKPMINRIRYFSNLIIIIIFKGNMGDHR